MPGTLVLRVESGPAAGQDFDVASGAPVVGGRSPDCGLPISDPGLSRRHFELSWDGAACRIVDLESTNGTFVNEQRVSETELRNGDRLSAGDSVFRIEITPAASAEAAPPAAEPPAAAPPAQAPAAAPAAAAPPEAAPSPQTPAPAAAASPESSAEPPAAPAAAVAGTAAVAAVAAGSAAAAQSAPPADVASAAAPGAPDAASAAAPGAPDAASGAAPGAPDAAAAPVLVEPPAEPIEVFPDLDPKAASEPAPTPEPDTPYAALMALLAEGGSDAVFAIVDGTIALELALQARVLGHRLLTLFGPEMAPGAHMGPLLVVLEPDPLRFLARWSAALGESPGVLLQTAASEPVCFKHVFGVFHGQNEQGELEFVRFYDPAALRALIASSSADECRALFGPIRRFIVENEAGDGFEALRPPD
jgi:hypothetical protein